MDTANKPSGSVLPCGLRLGDVDTLGDVGTLGVLWCVLVCVVVCVCCVLLGRVLTDETRGAEEADAARERSDS